MKPEQAYNLWAAQYDTNHNKTRDLEGQAMRTILAEVPFNNCLEIGCGTGKNTEWLARRAGHVTAVDLSEEMLAKAKVKITSSHVQFLQADITSAWAFGNPPYDLVTFSLVLEHIQNLDHVFRETAHVLGAGGRVYIGELHPFKQYTGSKARFDTDEGRQIVECYTHHISEFTQTARKHGLTLVDLNEYFDDNDNTSIPRILTILLQKA